MYEQAYCKMCSEPIRRGVMAWWIFDGKVDFGPLHNEMCRDKVRDLILENRYR